MKFFRKSHQEKTPEKTEFTGNNEPLSPESLPQNLTAEEAAALWFEHRFGAPMPDSVTTLFKSLIRTELKRRQADSSLLSATETGKLNETLRLNETKLRNIETSIDKIHQQQEWYRKFIALSHALEKEKAELYQLNKQYASMQKSIQELERFETFESRQGSFQKIQLIKQMREALKSLIQQLYQDKEQCEKHYHQIKEEYEQQTLSRKEYETVLKRTDDLLTEVYLTNGKLQILELNEGKESEVSAQWAMNITSLTKEIGEIKLELEEEYRKQESLNLIRQETDVHQKMIDKGEGVLVKLDLLYTLLLRKERTQQELDNSLRKQSEQNAQLNKLFTNIKELESQISSLQNELAMHLKSNYGMDGEKLQSRTMELKRRMQMLLSAQVLWNHISQGYNWIDEKMQEIYRLQTQAESTHNALEQLNTEVNILKEKTEEKKYSFTVSKSQNVIQLRSDLKEGSSCSVCGATHHPYHSDTMLEQSKLISEMKTDLEMLEAEYNKKNRQLQELRMKYARETGILEVEQTHLEMIRNMHQQNIQEWKKFEDLDRSFRDCSASTNQEARRSMLQQLIERTGQDAEEAAKELEIFNFHQSNINSINGKIAKKENEKNDIMMRFNEQNTGCQVWAYRISHLQEEISMLNDRFSELFDDLEKIITISGWFKAWQNNQEGLKIQIQNILKKYRGLITDTEANKERILMLQQKKDLLEDRLKIMVNAQEASAKRLEQVQNLKKECGNTLQKLIGNQEAKQVYDNATCNLEEARKQEEELQKQKEQAKQELCLKTGAIEAVETRDKELEQEIMQEKSDLDLWMRKYNASHSPVQFSELQQLFSADTDWQQMRQLTRHLKFELSMAQKKVDLLQAELAAHQADGNRPGESSEKEVHSMLIERKEMLEQERKNIIGMIAACQAQLINQKEKLDAIKLCEEEIKNKITE